MDQVHVFEVHESLTDFPLLIDASVHDVPLGSGCKLRTTGDFRGDVDLQPWIRGTGRAAWRPRTQDCYE